MSSTLQNIDPSTIESLSSLSSLDLDSDLLIGRLINKAKFSVHLATCPSTSEQFALKLFPYVKNRISRNYLNEARFSYLKHPNIITIFKAKDLEENFFEEKVSYIQMEFAPNGDLGNVLSSNKVSFDEKLTRTYFHQLIQGMEYLHSYGIAHLDLKPKNLLLDQNFQLRIADFDLAFIEGDEIVRSKGTTYFRAPELLFGSCRDPKAADIFSAGIILFVMITSGKLPQTENIAYKGVNLFELMTNEPEKFWAFHCSEIEGRSEYFTKEFREIFHKMTSLSVSERGTINEIKEMKWYKGAIYRNDELKELMKSESFNLV